MRVPGLYFHQYLGASDITRMALQLCSIHPSSGISDAKQPHGFVSAKDTEISHSNAKHDLVHHQCSNLAPPLPPLVIPRFHNLLAHPPPSCSFIYIYFPSCALQPSFPSSSSYSDLPYVLFFRLGLGLGLWISLLVVGWLVLLLLLGKNVPSPDSPHCDGCYDARKSYFHLSVKNKQTNK